jgi:hypothetical protein
MMIGSQGSNNELVQGFVSQKWGGFMILGDANDMGRREMSRDKEGAVYLGLQKDVLLSMVFSIFLPVSRSLFAVNVMTKNDKTAVTIFALPKHAACGYWSSLISPTPVNKPVLVPTPSFVIPLR